MLDLKKKVDIIEKEELRVTNCPICSAYVCHVYYMQDASTKKKSKWFSCSCGVVFNSQKPSIKYDRNYIDKYVEYGEKKKDEYQYPIKVYAPIIEELIYGRRVLLVGQINPYQSEAFASRGWVPTIIDKNSSIVSQDNYISEDFETHKFPESIKYNMIWIYNTLECFNNPVGSLELCHKLLAEDGIIFIGTPDTDFINTRSSSCFIHWKHDENYIMWNRRSITRHLEHLGFNVILARQNYEHRFPVWDDIHLIAQKKFF